MASEDSDQIVSGFLPIHGLRNFRDLDQTARRPVPALGDELDAAGELLEVLLLRTQHRMLLEERDDPPEQILALTDDVAEHVLPMVVVSPVGDDDSYAEELTKSFEARPAWLALCDRELVRDLETGPVASSPRTVWLPYEADREASFSVYKTDHPATELDQPFLLVFRITRHVVTVDTVSDVASSAGYPGFPAYSQMRTAPLPARGATISPKDLHISFEAMSP
jgi:hypothetical protein